MGSTPSTPEARQDEREPLLPAQEDPSTAKISEEPQRQRITWGSILDSAIDVATTAKCYDWIPIVNDVCRSLNTNLYASSSGDDDTVVRLESAIAASFLLWRRALLRLTVLSLALMIVFQALAATPGQGLSVQSSGLNESNVTLVYEACKRSAHEELQALNLSAPILIGNRPSKTVQCLQSSSRYLPCPTTLESLNVVNISSFVRNCWGEISATDEAFADRANLYNLFLSITGISLAVIGGVAMAFTCSALWNWQKYRKSRTAVIGAFLISAIGPNVIAMVPWYAVLSFDSVQPENTLDGLSYRIQIATNTGFTSSSAVLTLIPSLIVACGLWKSVAPESSMWGVAYYLFPTLAFFQNFPSYSFLLQLLSTWWFTTFAILQPCTYIPYLFIAGALNKHLESEPNEAIKFLNRASFATLALTFTSYLILLIPFVPLFIQAAPNLGSILNLLLKAFPPVQLLVLVFRYLSTYFTSLLLAADLLCFVVEALRCNDGAYTHPGRYVLPAGFEERTFAGIDSIMRLLLDSREEPFVPFAGPDGKVLLISDGITAFGTVVGVAVDATGKASDGVLDATMSSAAASKEWVKGQADKWRGEAGKDEAKEE